MTALDVFRPFMPFILVAGTAAALAGLVLTGRELWRRLRARLVVADISPRDWEREAQRGGDHDGRR